MPEQIVIVGGGLAGLSAAARLAFHGHAVTLIEKAPKLGRRAITIPLKGSNFNFGAHAIYRRDRSVLRRLESELGLRVDWRPFSPQKVFYDLGKEMTPVPSSLATLLRTGVLDAQHGEGQLSELSFSSAYQVAERVLSLRTGSASLVGV